MFGSVVGADLVFRTDGLGHHGGDARRKPHGETVGHEHQGHVEG
ncbi:hypothetical protein ES708_10312 [subsurface metagenome]